MNLSTISRAVVRSVQLTTPHLFRCYRWAAFRQVVDDIDKSVRAILIRT